MLFSILFWNIWFKNQIDGTNAPRTARLLNELKRLTDKYNPDCFGLSEVLQAQQEQSPFVSEYLKQQCGFTQNYYAPSAPLNDMWVTGTALCSKLNISKAETISLCNDSFAKRNGYPGFERKAIGVTLMLKPDKALNLIVTHPIHLTSYTLRDHFAGTEKLEQLVRSEKYSRNTILGGDLNELKYMPWSFRSHVKDIMHFRTGNILNTTWHHNGWRMALLRANLDQLYWTKESFFQLAKFEVLRTHVSDHKPILATFRYGTES
jgi:endonuclease/exonuclease/phosphatase family metal-dependent hydrolase